MELVKRICTYTHFQYVKTDLSDESVGYINRMKTLSGFTSYNETTFDHNEIVSALYNKFPPNQFSTSPGGSLSAYTIVNYVEPNLMNIGEYILLKPLFGDDTLLGLNLIDDIGDALGANPNNNVWIRKPYSGQTLGLAITQINEVLGFFKGFNIQPTYNSINTYFPLIERYLESPDVNSFTNVGISQYLRTTPRRVFNELGFIMTNYTGGTEDAYFNLPIYLTQTIHNIGLYELPYSAITDNKEILVLNVPNSYYLEYGIDALPTVVTAPTNNFTYILMDGITANTYSDFFETTSSQITGYTSDKSGKVRKYATEGIRYGYNLPSTPNSITFTLSRNTVPNVNDGYIEYTNTLPLSSSTRSLIRYNSWGRSPQNDNVGNVSRSFVSMVHDELNDKLVLEPKIKNDVFIDRGVFSPFERVYKFAYLRSLEDISSYERGEFNVVQGVPLERIYGVNG